MVMFRVLSAAAFCLILGACAFEPAPAPVQSRLKTVTITKTRVCTTTLQPQDVCKTPKSCPHITTCGEAYYRLTTCREALRDGGVAGVRNGIPCEDKCGATAVEMADRIAKQPYTPPAVSTTVCDPA